VGTLFRLNRLKLYLAANVSNPFLAPWLVLLEVQAGAWLRRGSFHRLSMESVKTLSVTGVGADLLIGSVAVGAVLSGFAGALTYTLVRRTQRNAFANLVRVASDRYITAGIVAWEFARGKLRADPIYKALVCGGLLTRASTEQVSSGRDSLHERSGSTLVDIGCGMGLSLALLAEARRATSAGTWPAEWPAPASFDRIVGIEVRRRVAAIAAEALGADADVIAGDARAVMPDRVHTVLLFDVLHLMLQDDQEALMAAIASALDADGLVLIREADAAAGWRFTAVRWGNRLKALAFGSWSQPFHFRTTSEWQACVARHGLQSEVREMSDGTPFANVLLVVTPRRSRSGA
jgi:SAM-dependent methyltransferase